MPGCVDACPATRRMRSNTSITFDAFFRYVTAMRPLPNDTPSMTASGRSGTTSRQCASSGCAASTATTRPFGAPLVVCRNSVPSMTVPDAWPGVADADDLACRSCRSCGTGRSRRATGRWTSCRSSSRARSQRPSRDKLPNGPHVVASFAFSAFVNCRKSSASFATGSCPCGGTAPGRCTGSFGFFRFW